MVILMYEDKDFHFVSSVHTLFNSELIFLML